MAKNHDITKRLSPVHAPALWDHLARRMAALLSKKYRIEVQHARAVLVEERFVDWSARLAQGAYQVSQYRIEGIRSPALFLVGSGAGDVICDLLLGGRPHQGNPPTSPAASHAMISRRVEARFIRVLAAQLEDELAAYGAGAFRYYNSESDIRLYNQIADTEVCASIRFEFVVAGNQTLGVDFVLPRAAVARLRPSNDDPHETSRLLVSYKHLASLDVDVSTTLAQLDMTLKDLVALTPGDVLAISEEPAVLRVEGRPFRRGHLLKDADGNWVFKSS